MADPMVEVIILDFEVEVDPTMAGVEKDFLRNLPAKLVANVAIHPNYNNRLH